MAKKSASSAPSSSRASSSSPPSSKAPPKASKEAAGAATPGDGASSEAPKAPLNPALMQREVMKSLGMRLGIPVAGAWLLAAFANRWWSYSVAGAVTATAAGLSFWAWQRIEKARKVTDILQSVQASDKEGRKAALDKLDANFKKDDTAAVFARAQLLMQDDPDAALAALESLDLTKVMPAEADQARFQRALIHLTRGEVDRARTLVDLIDLTRQEDAKARAMMGAVIAEAWARTGQAKRGLEILDKYKADDQAHAELRPQLWRARAFAAAATSDMKQVRHALRQLSAENPQYLGIFLQKKVHPLLAQEAKIMLMQSGTVQRPKPQYRYRLEPSAEGSIIRWPQPAPHKTTSTEARAAPKGSASQGDPATAR